MRFDRYAADFRATPLWWDEVSRPELPPLELPQQVEVLVIGSGYTGLAAALQTARGGRSTLVVDAEEAGWGCSTRNGGQVSPAFKRGLEDLERVHGRAGALAMLAEGHRAVEFLDEFIATERIDCDWHRGGHFIGAHNPRQYERLARSLESLPPELGEGACVVPRAEQHTEIETDAYHGGVVYPGHGALHPAAYHAGLLSRVTGAGALIAARCRVEQLRSGGDRVRARTSHGEVRARDVVIATNGYTSGATPWLRRRLIPIGSYIIATEVLPRDLAAALLPRRRTVSDTRRVVFYYRLSPDGRRLLFGGRVAVRESDPRVSAPRLHREMRAIFPQLAGTRISHSWVGFVGYTFDRMPHSGARDRIHYAAGYCGIGIALSSYFGTRIGRRLLGHNLEPSPLERTAFPARPYYFGDPWFLAPALLWYRICDRLPL
jgi:glycine/D-amino acid oxidase-like deaminating enzyme